MKTELRLSPHSIVSGANAVELWHGGVMIGCIYGDDGPGVRIVSKHHMLAASKGYQQPRVVTVEILAPEGGK